MKVNSTRMMKKTENKLISSKGKVKKEDFDSFCIKSKILSNTEVIEE